jgi:hypothetical protein
MVFIVFCKETFWIVDAQQPQLFEDAQAPVLTTSTQIDLFYQGWMRHLRGYL